MNKPPDPGGTPPDPGTPNTHKGRPDKKIASWERQYLQYSVVKKRLNSFLVDPKIRPFIHTSVTQLNKITLLAYHFLNFHFLRSLENGSDIPNKITQTMLYQACTAVSDLKGKPYKPVGKNVEWDKSVKEFRQRINGFIPLRDHCCNLINNNCQQMLVAINNHLNLNFGSRLAKYLRIIYKEDDSSRTHYWAQRILNIRQDSPQYKSKFADVKATEIVDKFQKELKIGKKLPDVASNLKIYLPFYLKILKTLKDYEKKGFSLFPLKGQYIPGYIKICNSALGDLMSHAGIPNGKSLVMKEKRKWWGTIFNLNSVETQKHRFSWEVLTNGYDVSILLESQKKPFPPGYIQCTSIEEKIAFISKLFPTPNTSPSPVTTNPLNSLNWDDWDAHIGADPGRRRLISAISGLDEKSKRLSCSAREWKDWTGQSRRQKRLNKRKDTNQNIQSLQKISFKVCTTTDYLSSLGELVPILQGLLDVYNESYYRKDKFSGYIRTQRAFERLIKRLQIGAKTLVGLGDGNINGRNCIRGGKLPIKKLYNRINCHSGIKAVWVDEANTSKMCSACHRVTGGDVSEWKIIEKFSGEAKLVKSKIYGLRRCMNNECRITWDRDHNARRNIYNVLESEIKSGAKPDYLRRGWKPSPIIKKKPIGATNCAIPDRQEHSK